MSDRIPYEWATLRVVPRVHAEEFLNVGVIVHAREAHFLETGLGTRWDARLAAFAPELDRERVERHLESYVRISRGEASAGPVALLPPSERFRWLTNPRSGIIQTSSVHPGLCSNPRTALEKLLAEQCS